MNAELEPKHSFLKVMLHAVWWLNLLDAINTHTAGDYEMNPLMRLAYSASPVVFFISKFTMCTVGVVALWRWRKEPGSIAASVLLFVLYAVTVVLQMIVQQGTRS